MHRYLALYDGSIVPREICIRVAHELGLAHDRVYARTWVTHPDGSRSVFPSSGELAEDDRGIILIETEAELLSYEFGDAVESALR